MRTSFHNLARAAIVSLLMVFAIPSTASATVHDASGGTVIFKDSGSSATFTANAVQRPGSWSCFNQLPEYVVEFQFGGIRTGQGASRGVDGTFVMSIGGSTFSPRFAGQTFNSNTTTSIQLTFNNATFVTALTAGTTASLSYTAGVNGFMAAPNSGGLASTYDNYKPLSFSALAFSTTGFVNQASTICSGGGGGSAPSVTSAEVRGDGRTVRLNLSSTVGSGLGGPGSDFALTVNGGPVAVVSVVRNGSLIDLELGMYQIGRTSTVTVAKVGSIYNYGTSPNLLANFSARSVTNNSTATVVNQSLVQAGGSSTPAPIKYSGPEFSSLSLKPVLNGSGTTLEGRKLDQISSITIDGKAAKLSDATDKSLKLELPAGLKPGVYDLVVNTASHGKLTHMNAIRIREELAATSLTIKGSGVLSGEEFKKLTAFARTQNPDMSTVTCIVNSSSEGKSFTQARALCDRIAASNLNIKTTMFENRSTVEGSAIFARVVFSSDE